MWRVGRTSHGSKVVSPLREEDTDGNNDEDEGGEEEEEAEGLADDHRRPPLPLLPPKLSLTPLS